MTRGMTGTVVLTIGEMNLPAFLGVLSEGQFPCPAPLRPEGSIERVPRVIAITSSDVFLLSISTQADPTRRVTD